MNAARQSLEGFLRHYLLAVQYFTRVPVTGTLAAWVGFTPDMLRASAPHFPGVGWLVGMAAAVTFAVLSLLLPDTTMTPLAAAVGCTVATVLLTGAFHEGGLAALADGLAGGAERERALAPVKDSRLGVDGALALLLALAAKITLLGVLAARSPGAVLTVLLAAHTVSRFWPLVLVHTLPHIGDAGASSRPLADHIERRALAVAAAWCIVPLALMALTHGAGFMLAALAASGLALWGIRRLLARRLQGFTADGLGAAQQVCELAFYLGAAVAIA